MNVSINKKIFMNSAIKAFTKNAPSTSKACSTPSRAIKNAVYASVQADLMRLGMSRQKARATVLTNLCNPLKKCSCTVRKQATENKR